MNFFFFANNGICLNNLACGMVSIFGFFEVLRFFFLIFAENAERSRFKDAIAWEGAW